MEGEVCFCMNEQGGSLSTSEWMRGGKPSVRRKKESRKKLLRFMREHKELI